MFSPCRNGVFIERVERSCGAFRIFASRWRCVSLIEVIAMPEFEWPGVDPR
jgi:hypothetical protein